MLFFSRTIVSAFLSLVVVSGILVAGGAVRSTHMSHARYALGKTYNLAPLLHGRRSVLSAKLREHVDSMFFVDPSHLNRIHGTGTVRGSSHTGFLKAYNVLYTWMEEGVESKRDHLTLWLIVSHLVLQWVQLQRLFRNGCLHNDYTRRKGEKAKSITPWTALDSNRDLQVDAEMMATFKYQASQFAIEHRLPGGQLAKNDCADPLADLFRLAYLADEYLNNFIESP